MKDSNEYSWLIYFEKHQVTTLALPVSILSVHLPLLQVTFCFDTKSEKET